MGLEIGELIEPPWFRITFQFNLSLLKHMNKEYEHIHL